MLSKAENRITIANALEQHRNKLGDERFEQMIDELNEVSFAYATKKQGLLNDPVVAMDKNATEVRRLNREEDLKWVLIKQKYGI